MSEQIETVDSLRARVLTLEQALRLLHNESGAYRSHVASWIAMSGDRRAGARLEKALVQARLAAAVARSESGDKLLHKNVHAEAVTHHNELREAPPESESGACRKCGRRSEPVPECIRNEARLAGHKWWCAACGYPVGCHYYDAQNAPPDPHTLTAHDGCDPDVCAIAHAQRAWRARGNAPPPSEIIGAARRAKENASCPPTWTAHWRERHRGHGCRQDPDALRNAPRPEAQPAPVELTDAASVLAWAQACIVRAARALVLAAGGNGVDGASLAETAAGVAAGLMEVDAAIALGGAAASDSGAPLAPAIPARVLCACAEVTPDGSDWKGKPGCTLCGGAGEHEAAP